jgi:hypothetical protein
MPKEVQQSRIFSLVLRGQVHTYQCAVTLPHWLGQELWFVASPCFTVRARVHIELHRNTVCPARCESQQNVGLWAIGFISTSSFYARNSGVELFLVPQYLGNF